MRSIFLPLAAFASLAGMALADTSSPIHDESFTGEGLLKSDVSGLKDTQMVAQPDVPLTPGQNVLWCGTMQLVWNKAIDLVGEKLQFTTKSPVAGMLNRQSFTGADLNPDSYVAIADFERDNVENEIRAALEKTFHGAASPELIPARPENPGQDDFVAYAYLYKNLAFGHPFFENRPMSFGDKPVQNFGYTTYRGATDEILKQISIYDYQSDDDLIVKLKTESSDDELILAKVAPGATLQKTIDLTLKRMAGAKPVSATSSDILCVPKLNFDLVKDYADLVGLTLKPGPAAKIKSALTIVEARQLIRFQLNENGAKLKSEAVMAVATSDGGPDVVHSMVFDKPFLILMKQAKSDQPYFALWVGNASLLVPAVKDVP